MNLIFTQDLGYEVTHDGKCITVFSAPNYCDTMGNKGAFIVLNGKEMLPNYTTYEGQYFILKVFKKSYHNLPKNISCFT